MANSSSPKRPLMTARIEALKIRLLSEQTSPRNADQNAKVVGRINSGVIETTKTK